MQLHIIIIPCLLFQVTLSQGIQKLWSNGDYVPSHTNPGIITITVNSSITITSTSIASSKTTLTTTISPHIMTSTKPTGTKSSVPSPVQSGIASYCDTYYKVQAGDTCDAVEQTFNISAADFLAWNPAVGSGCKYLELNVYVCIGIKVPYPVQKGITPDCTVYYKVQAGDTCYDLTQKNGISLEEFYTWNPAVGSACEYLALGYYVCIFTS